MTTVAHFRSQAAKCRDLAKHADEPTAANLLFLAEEYEAEARKLESEPDAEPPSPIPE